MKRVTYLGSAFLVFALSGSVYAADLPSKNESPAAEEPSAVCLDKNGLVNDVFGFNSGTDVNDLNQFSLSGNYQGVYGGRSGFLSQNSGSAQITYSPYHCLETDPFVFSGGTNSKTFGVKGIGSTAGGGIELKYKLLGRDTQGIGLTFDLVQQSAATNGAYYTLIGRSSDMHDTIFSVFADMELISDKLYAAFNISYDLNFQALGGPRSGYANTSVGRVGAALSYKLTADLFIGVEASHFRRYDTLAFGDQLGQATFLGPNFYWSVASNWGLSGSFNAQVAGQAKGTQSDLDLVNFSHYIAKLKLNHDF